MWGSDFESTFVCLFLESIKKQRSVVGQIDKADISIKNQVLYVSKMYKYTYCKIKKNNFFNHFWMSSKKIDNIVKTCTCKKYLACSWVYQIHCIVIFIRNWNGWHKTVNFWKSALKIIFWMGYSCSIYSWCLMGTLECWNPWKTWILGPPSHYSRHSSTT